VIGRNVDRRRPLGPVTVEALDGDVVVDDVLHRNTHWGIGVVDITCFVMAGLAVVSMRAQDVRPILHRMAIGARSGINLAQVGRVNRHGMLFAAAGAMVVTCEVGRMAVDTLAVSAFTTGTVTGRAFVSAVGQVVAGGAAIGGMDLTCSDEGRCRGRDIAMVAADTVLGNCVEFRILLNRTAVVVVMAKEVIGMALDAGATPAAVESGVAVTVDADNAGAVDA